MRFISDILTTIQANKKIDRTKKERKLEARTQELVEKYGISEEEAAAKARLEHGFDNFTKKIGKIAPPPPEKKKSSEKKKDDNMFGDTGFRF